MSDTREEFETWYLANIAEIELSADLARTGFHARQAEIDALKAENEALRKVVFESRDQLKYSPIECLGDGYTKDNEPYPIRDEMIHRMSVALLSSKASK